MNIDFELLLRLMSVIVLPLVGVISGGVIWLWRELSTGKKELELLRLRVTSLEKEVDNLPGHKLYGDLRQAMAEMSKSFAVQNTELLGVLRANQAETKTMFSGVQENIKELKESRLRHDALLAERS